MRLIVRGTEEKERPRGVHLGKRKNETWREAGKLVPEPYYSNCSQGERWNGDVGIKWTRKGINQKKGYSMKVAAEKIKRKARLGELTGATNTSTDP